MRIVSVAPKEVYVTLELSLTQVKQITAFMDRALPLCHKVYDDTDPELVDFVQNGFSDILKALIKNVERGE